jgi:hypothetical protein
MGDDEKIPVITSVSGETYNDVRVMERNGDSVKIMYRDGIKTLKYSDLDQKSAKLLGFDEYKKELAEQLENEQKQSKATEAEEKRTKLAREAFILQIRNKKKKESLDWFYIYLLGERDLKVAFGRPPDFQSGDALMWRGCCWNPITEKMDDIWVRNTTYNHGNRRTGEIQYTFKSLVFECGSNEYEMINASTYLEKLEKLFTK